MGACVLCSVELLVVMRTASSYIGNIYCCSSHTP
jgi:hypothetical protein